MYAVCPSCGKPLRIEKTEGDEGWAVCSDVCYDPSSLPTGMRTLPDQATKVYTDGSMQELTRQEYIKKHGFDPEPVMQAIGKWREDQIRKWMPQFKTEDEVVAWIRRISKKPS
ncbi:MAG: hypothetical protein MUO26_09585 [Methanotrichaceae archaeon]|nr:hypothetical protein [Methanotrichaceae archaeon]